MLLNCNQSCIVVPYDSIGCCDMPLFAAICVVVMVDNHRLSFLWLIVITVSFFSMNGYHCGCNKCLALDRAGKMAGSGAAL